MLSLNAILAQQQPSWQKEQILPPGTEVFRVDSFPLLRESLQFQQIGGAEATPEYRWSGDSLIFEPALTDSLKMTYQVLEIALLKPYRRKDTTLIIPPMQAKPQQLEELAYRQEQNQFKPFKGLNSQGSISRSISVGNNQDAVLNSDLNLQLSGKIGARTTLRASLTDNSLPVQPDGFTQQLREFDRAYLELENPDFGRLRAGDYNMVSASNPFLRFDKRISGAGLYTSFGDENAAVPLRLEGGIARGKFARNRFQGVEGNQGPYRLRGANNENFIIIISGSERVYIDGVLQKRGQQYDYVIDYNAGEITFTALQPITRDKRIVVEFQYTEQNFLRSVVYGETGYQSPRWKSRVQFYSEQDSKNRQLVSDYTDEQKARLAAVGDDLGAARVSSIEPAEFSEDRILYRLTDSLGFDSVLVFSRDSSRALVSASFAFVGTGQGNYRLAQNEANGRVFRWVAPVNGQPQGDYSPQRLLVAPNQLQILSFETSGEIDDRQSLALSVASSRNDINLFSDRDKSDDVGLAGRLSYQFEQPLKKRVLRTQLNYEFNNRQFVTIERVRRVEFARDWNLPFNYQREVQLGEVALGLIGDSLKLNYNIEGLSAQGTRGIRQNLRWNWLHPRQRWRGAVSWLESEDTLRNTRFLREMTDYQFFLTPRWWLGAASIGEFNLRRALGDSITPGSYSFIEYEGRVGFGDTTQSFIEAGYRQRQDDSLSFNQLAIFTRAESYFTRGTWRNDFGGRFNANLLSRELTVLRPEKSPLERTLTSRLSYQQRLFKNTIVSNTFYESGAGTEPRRSFNYVEVPAGTGTYTHTDYNGNGIRELDEFEVAPTPDLANYVRVFVPNTDFVRTSIVKFGQNLSLNAPNQWLQAQGLKKLLARFSFLGNLQLDRKTLLESTQNRLNPFDRSVADSQVVALADNFRSTIFYNRASNTFGGDYTYRVSENRSLLSFGVESRRVRENILNLRLGLGKAFIFRIQGKTTQQVNESGNFRSRNFSIDGYSSRYALSYQPRDQLTLTASHEVNSEDGASEDGGSLLVSQNSGLELSYNLATELSLLFQANYIFNGFEGDANSPLGYELLQALQPGDNAVLNLTLQRTFLKNIVLSLNYSGRFSRQAFAIHTGNVQVKAFF